MYRRDSVIYREYQNPVHAYGLRFVRSYDNPNRHYMDNNQSVVRIPSMLRVKEDIHTTLQSIKDYWESSGTQIGTYVYYYYGMIKCIRTFLNIEGNQVAYRAQNPTNVHCIYPILQSFTNSLCLGLFFTQDMNAGNRQFIRRPLPGQQQFIPTGGVHDITEEIFVQGRPLNQLLVSKQSHMFAIYVCGGARLVVNDTRCQAMVGMNVEEEYNKTFSLLQQGSFVICEGIIRFTIHSPSIHNQQPRRIIALDQALGQQSFIPDDLRTALLARGVADIPKRYVIFIGAMNESICWELVVGNATHLLNVPDGGYVLGIEPWDDGFQEVICRHRYEQLYNAVLSPVVPQLGFSPLQHQWLNKVLGLDNEALREFTVDLSPYIPQVFRYQGSTGYVERVLRRDVLDARPHVPPIRLPIFRNPGFEYTGEQPILENLNLENVVDWNEEYEKWKIGYCLYSESREQFWEYEWENPQNMDTFEATNQFNPQIHRIGIDFKVYTKTNQKIGVVWSWVYLPYHPGG